MNQNKTKFSTWNYLKKYKVGCFLYVFLNLLGSLGTIATTILAANSIEAITDHLWSKGIHLSLIVLVVVLFEQLSWYLANVVFFTTSSKFTLELNTDLANQAFKFTSKTYSDHDTGTFTQRIIEDPERIVDNLAEIVDSVADLITAMALFMYIATLNITLSLLLIALLVVCTILEMWRVRVRKNKRWKLKEKTDKVHSLTTEIVRSERDIKSMGLEEKLNEEAHANYEDLHVYKKKYQIVDATFWNVRNFLIKFFTTAILILGIVFIRKDIISLAVFMIIYSNRGSLQNVIWGLGRIGNMVAEIKISSNRMSELFNEVEFVTEDFGDVELPESRGGGKIAFKNVSYSYKTSEFVEVKKKHKKKKVENIINTNKIFDNLSFEIQPNTTVAFVGKSGSGKSTILNLISKMYVVDDGEILINDININDLTKNSLRRTISLVNQFPYIFNMTIRENLLLAKKDATESEINKAIKDANLKEFIDTLPYKMETKVGESGIKLSGGQRQRLAIARALLRNSSIIIFDESTSSLDNFAQGEIKKSIDALRGKSTVVIVAHRLSTIKNVDHIFFLDEGKIIDQGTFEELFETNDKFKAMFLAENV